MLINGEWLVCDDGIVRPVIRGEVLATNGSWVPVPFLLDTGADRTVGSVLSLRPCICVRSLLQNASVVWEERSGLSGSTHACA